MLLLLPGGRPRTGILPNIRPPRIYQSVRDTSEPIGINVYKIAINSLFKYLLLIYALGNWNAQIQSNEYKKKKNSKRRITTDR